MEQKKKTYGQKASPAVEAPAEDTVKVRSLRLSDDTVEELNAAKKALDVRTMDEAMQAILDTFSMSMAKDAIPERATEIGEFEVLCRRLVDAYTHSLILCHDADERAQEVVRAKMDDLNSTISQLTRMQTQSDQKIHELEGVNKKLVSELRQANAERDALSAELAAMKKSEHLDTNLMSRFDELQKQVTALLAKKCVRRLARSPRPAKLSSRSAEIEQWHRPD